MPGAGRRGGGAVGGGRREALEAISEEACDQPRAVDPATRRTRPRAAMPAADAGASQPDAGEYQVQAGDGTYTPGAQRRIRLWLRDTSDRHLAEGAGRHAFPAEPAYPSRPASRASRHSARSSLSSLRPATGSTSRTMAALAAAVQQRFGNLHA